MSGICSDCGGYYERLGAHTACRYKGRHEREKKFKILQEYEFKKYVASLENNDKISKEELEKRYQDVYKNIYSIHPILINQIHSIANHIVMTADLYNQYLDHRHYLPNDPVEIRYYSNNGVICPYINHKTIFAKMARNK